MKRIFAVLFVVFLLTACSYNDELANNQTANASETEVQKSGIQEPETISREEYTPQMSRESIRVDTDAAEALPGPTLNNSDEVEVEKGNDQACHSTKQTSDDSNNIEESQETFVESETILKEEIILETPAEPAVPETSPAPIPEPTQEPTSTDIPKDSNSGYRKSLAESYSKNVFDAVNALKAEKGYISAIWNSSLANGAQKWANSLIDESIQKNKYVHYHDSGRDSNESIIWISSGTSARTLAAQIEKHSSSCITEGTEIGIGAAIWDECPIGDSMGFIVVRYYK